MRFLHRHHETRRRCPCSGWGVSTACRSDGHQRFHRTPVPKDYHCVCGATVPLSPRKGKPGVVFVAAHDFQPPAIEAEARP